MINQQSITYSVWKRITMWIWKRKARLHGRYCLYHISSHIHSPCSYRRVEFEMKAPFVLYVVPIRGRCPRKRLGLEMSIAYIDIIVAEVLKSLLFRLTFGQSVESRKSKMNSWMVALATFSPTCYQERCWINLKARCGAAYLLPPLLEPHSSFHSHLYFPLLVFKIFW